MPTCCIVQCGARKDKNQPQLTLHRFPKNESLRKKWLVAVGSENINPRHKDWYLCSLHFEEKCFNRTLDVMRLHDNSVPTIFPTFKTKEVSVLRETGNIEKNSAPSMPAVLPSLQLPNTPYEKELSPKVSSALSETGNIEKYDLPCSSAAATSVLPLPQQSGHKKALNPKVSSGLSETGNIEKYDLSCSSAAATSVLPLPQQSGHEKIVQEDKTRILKEKLAKQRLKIKRLNEKVRRKNKKIANLQDILNDLRNRNQINNEQSVLMEELAGPQDFLKRQVNKSKGLPLPNKYSEEIRKFALTLHFLSPKAYNYIRRTYNTCLPHTRTLSKWYQHVNAEPGFTKEAFDTLKIKVVGSAHPIVCALVFDEMAIRKSLTWDPTAQKYYGRVDYGHNLDSDSVDEASQALVLLLTSINGTWKIPIGYFLITALTGEQKSIIVETAINLCEEVGVKVVALTCDGPAANLSMFATLGCDVLKSNVTFFERGGSRIHVFIDPCHAVKLVRNSFGELRVFVDALGRKVDFKYLEELQQLQEKKGLHLANKIKKTHILYQKQKMKVKLATQLFSNSVADALTYCRDELKLKEFEDCEGTVNFINIMNDVFDVLNSHSIRPPGHKKAMCPSNIGIITALFEGATSYLTHLKLPSGELLINTRRKTGFVGLLVDMRSALALYQYLVQETKMLKYIPMYKISQDHIELFFSAVRTRGGFNNNPNAIQFRAAYKKLLVRAEIRDNGIGNCTPLEQVNILTCSSTNPIEALNDLTEKKCTAEVTDQNDLYNKYIECILFSNTDAYADSVVEYIAGFVTKKLLRTIKCEICQWLLIGEEDIKSLIYLKTRGGLQYASASVIDILKKTEKIIKTHFESQMKPELYYLHIFKFLCELCDLENYFSTDNDPEHNGTHKCLLIKSIIKTFLDIRFRYHGRMQCDRVSQRQFLNKLTLFRNE